MEAIYTITESQLDDIHAANDAAFQLFQQMTEIGNANVRIIAAAFRLFHAVEAVDPMYLSQDAVDALHGFRAIVEENVSS